MEGKRDEERQKLRGKEGRREEGRVGRCVAEQM